MVLPNLGGVYLQSHVFVALPQPQGFYVTAQKVFREAFLRTHPNQAPNTRLTRTDQYNYSPPILFESHQLEP